MASISLLVVRACWTRFSHGYSPAVENMPEVAKRGTGDMGAMVMSETTRLGDVDLIDVQMSNDGRRWNIQSRAMGGLQKHGCLMLTARGASLPNESGKRIPRESSSRSLNDLVGRIAGMGRPSACGKGSGIPHIFR